MDEATAEEVVERLRARRVFASLNRRAGVYNVGAAGLEAMILRDGVLVGFVPQVPDSDDLGAVAIADLIADTDYDAPMTTPAHETAAPKQTATPPAPPAPPTEKPRSWFGIRRSR